ncbi:protein CrcB-like protein [Negativibacillus massiliensis]|uniref:protein CrcB-like protein n=1 Tax=Negativibacillus massiliensis TaxID=1871035 RepID=UPI003AF2E161
MKAYGLFLLAAIVCALFSNQIDKICGMDNQLKKVLLVFSAGVFLVCMIGVAVSIFSILEMG